MRQSVISELNSLFRTSVYFHQILEKEPVLVDAGNYVADESLIREARAIQSILHTDDPHAVLIQPSLSASPVIFRYRRLPFSQVIALRNRGEKPNLLTANLIATDLEKQLIILHHRSPKSHLYPDMLSIPGGGFCPPDGLGRSGEMHITGTASREFNEETRLTAHIRNDTAIVLTEEPETGAVQFNFLGATTQIPDNRNSGWEGDVMVIHFNALYETLVTRKWAPLGKSCVLAWLALGAPGTENAIFDGLTADALYRKYINAMNIPEGSG
ncbi:MAG: hypothetical protein AABY47_05165 [Pseudomonadota bacterium]